MPEEFLRFCVTDKEIYDVLMSARQRINDSALRDMAKSRGMFLSPKDARETLADELALLPHDYEDIVEMLGQSENPNRAEKVTSLTLNERLTMEDIRAVCSEFKDLSPPDEKVVSHSEAADKY